MRTYPILGSASKFAASSSSWTNAVDHGAKADGATNDAPAIQALIDAASPGDIIYLPAGRYRLRSGLKWKSDLSLIGDGPGRTVLVPYNAGPFAPGFSAIHNFTDGSVGSPLTDCLFRDFEVDGSGVSTTSYDLGAKGINILYMRRARFENLYVHDCEASGIGCDQLVDSVITGCVVVGNGRLNNGSQSGGAGIGIGTGKYATMGLVIEGCTARNNATHGIFLEHQPGTSTRSFGVKIVGCHVEGNRYGISDWGVDGLEVSASTFAGNTVYGFGSTGQGVAGFAGNNGSIEACSFTGHTVNAVRFGDSTIRYRVSGCTMKLGSSHAIQVADVSGAGSTCQELTFVDNDIVANAAAGIRVDNTVTDLTIVGNRLRNNGTNTGGTTAARSGISLNATVTRCTIARNRAWDNQGSKTQTYGLNLSASAAVTGADMAANDFVGNLTGAYLNSGSLALSASPVRKVATTAMSPSATANTAGTTQTLTPTAGRLWFTAIWGLVVTWGGTFGSETATLNVTVTFNNGTTASTTITATATGSAVPNNSSLQNITGDGRTVTQVVFSVQSTIPSSAATATVTMLAIQD